MVLTTKCTHDNTAQKKNFFSVGNFTYCSFICNLELNDPQKGMMKNKLKISLKYLEKVLCIKTDRYMHRTKLSLKMILNIITKL